MDATKAKRCMAATYRAPVDRRLELPDPEARRYGHLAEQAFVAAGPGAAGGAVRRRGTPAPVR